MTNQPRDRDSRSRQVRPFLAAAFAGDVSAVSDALAADTSLATARGPHPVWGGEPVALHVAAERGRTEVVRQLLAAGVPPDAPDASYDGWSPLLIAIVKGHDEIAALLRAAGAIDDVWTAAARGDEGRVAALLAENPACAVALGPNQATALHFAATEAVARRLQAAGAALSFRDQYGRTPAEATLFGGPRARDAARYLTLLAGDNSLVAAAALGDADRVRELLASTPYDQHPTVSGFGPSETRGASALHVAAAFGELDVLDALLAAGASPNQPSADGERPLHLAAKHGRLAVAMRLLAAGADPALRDEVHDATSFDWAVFFEQQGVQGLLRETEGE